MSLVNGIYLSLAGTANGRISFLTFLSKFHTRSSPSKLNFTCIIMILICHDLSLASLRYAEFEFILTLKCYLGFVALRVVSRKN